MNNPGVERRKSMLTDDDKKFISYIASGNGSKKILGFKVQELVIIGSIVTGIFAFYIRTDDAIRHLIKQSDYLLAFTNNSDIYHSTVLGVQFRQGMPVDITYSLDKIRNNIGAPKPTEAK